MLVESLNQEPISNRPTRIDHKSTTVYCIASHSNQASFIKHFWFFDEISLSVALYGNDNDDAKIAAEATSHFSRKIRFDIQLKAATVNGDSR